MPSITCIPEGGKSVSMDVNFRSSPPVSPAVGSSVKVEDSTLNKTAKDDDPKAGAPATVSDVENTLVPRSRGAADSTTTDGAGAGDAVAKRMAERKAAVAVAALRSDSTTTDSVVNDAGAGAGDGGGAGDAAAGGGAAAAATAAAKAKAAALRPIARDGPIVDVAANGVPPKGGAARTKGRRTNKNKSRSRKHKKPSTRRKKRRGTIKRHRRKTKKNIRTRRHTR